jgi:hypothetical protein
MWRDAAESHPWPAIDSDPRVGTDAANDRRMTHPIRFLVPSLLTASLVVPACEFDSATAAEMRMAVDEVVSTGQAASLEDGVVEITTDFTLADGLHGVLAQVRSLVESQIPCSTIEAPDDHTLVIDFGTLEDSCEFRGRTFAGIVTVSYEVAGDEVVVTHDYEGITDGRATLDGRAVVTWRDRSRRIVTDFDFHGARGDFSSDGDRTQTLIGGVGDGIRVAGERNWHGERGDWHLEIEDVEMRAIDPVPQDGAYVLTTANGKEITMTFERIDEDTIEVTVTGGRRDRVYRVTSAGDVAET